MKLRAMAMGLVLLVLTGCTALLEREYSVTEPHSSKFWESEAAGTLRAENHQDIVNDLLLLIGRHTETATIRLYNAEDDPQVADMVASATVEVQQETPMGAYAVEFITTAVQEQRGYYEISVQLGYRRSAEQIQAVVNATSPEAVYSLLESALNTGASELAVRISYWGTDGREKVESSVAQLREAYALTEEEQPWLVQYYPAEGSIGLVEFLLQPTQEQLAKHNPPETVDDGEGAVPLPEEEPGGDSADRSRPEPPEEDSEKIIENLEQGA